MQHKVLCIDDESHNLEALERLLRKTFQVVTASSGPEGLEKLKDHRFSLIISDQKMPDMTGVEFFTQAKEQQPEAVRILLTGYTDLESVISAINQGQIYRYITKPWEPEEFLAITKQAIEVFEMKGTIARQNRELQEANEQLKSLDKMKTDFMMLVNHELKTPLTGIFSYVQLIQEESLNAEQDLYIKKISKNTQRLQDLINDTLLITRIQANSENLDKEDLNLVDLIRSQFIELNKDFQDKKMSLEVANTEAFVQRVNEKYIGIVIKKLIHNCLTHGKPDTKIELKLLEEKEHWLLHVKNHLTKPVEKTPEQLLSAFSTSENMLNHAGGTGLGLAVIHGILRMFSGSIEIDTNATTFALTLQIPK
jgi:two-component system sensor histidine kinase/response regulator